MENTKTQTKTESHDTEYHPLDTLESEVYSRNYKEAMAKAAKHKTIGKALLFIGIGFAVSYFPLFFLFKGMNCQDDQLGYCDFFHFIYLAPLFLIGIVLFIIGIIIYVHAKRILENKVKIRTE